MIFLATNRPPNPEEFEIICQLVYKHCRIQLATEKKQEVASRLGSRMQAIGMGGYKEYCAFLETRAGEGELSDFLAGLAEDRSGMFARRRELRFLTEEVLPLWTADAARQPGDVFRAWLPACGAGEDAYSVAVALADYFTPRPDFGGRVAASDPSRRLLDRARDAVYRMEEAQWPNPDWRRKYFVRGVGAYHGWWRLREEIKHMVTFRQASLFDTQWPFAGRMDAILGGDFNRFDFQVQATLSGRMAQHLAPGGFLMLGDAGVFRKNSSRRVLP